MLMVSAMGWMFSVTNSQFEDLMPNFSLDKYIYYKELAPAIVGAGNS